MASLGKIKVDVNVISAMCKLDYGDFSDGLFWLEFLVLKDVHERVHLVDRFEIKKASIYCSPFL